jgi:branched-chain amino acid transport system substrate-binding protein
MKDAGDILDLPVAGVEWFNWNSDILDTLVMSLAQKQVPCVALVANTPEGVSIVRAISDLPEDQRPRIYSHWGITGGSFTEQIGLEALSKVSLKYLQTLAYNNPKTERGQQLVSSFESTYGKQDGHNAFNGVAHAYDLVHLLALAVEQAGTHEAKDVQASLENLGSFEGAMKTYERPFSATNHEALSPDDYVLLKFNERGFGVK